MRLGIEEQLAVDQVLRHLVVALIQRHHHESVAGLLHVDLLGVHDARRVAGLVGYGARQAPS